jgi:predicted patatin/cPLA2 family phospholipase
MVKKTAWIFPGGAAKTVYSAGVLYALCEMKIPRPDIIIAGSGMAATSLGYVTGQHEIIKRVWCNLLSTKKFVNFWRFWKIINIDYLIDVVLKEKNPIDMKKVAKSPIKVYFPLINSKNGKIEYFSNKMKLDIWEILRAAKSVPFFTGLFSVKGVKIKGKFYADSLASTRFQLHVKKAIKEGAKKIFVFDNFHLDDNLNKFFFSKLMSRLRNKRYKKNQLEYIKKIENFSVPKGIEFIRFAPKKKLGINPCQNDQESAKRIFNRGYKETFDNELLKKYVY